MKTICLLLLLAAFPAYSQEIYGTAHVIDGDTIHVISSGGTIKVRLQGIAAPE